MKTCPHCAEDIQPAAVVCKHCHRDLVAPVPRAQSSTRRWILSACLVIGVLLAGTYVLNEYQRYHAFKAQLEAWHRECDAYTASPEGNDGKRACAEEMRALMAAARR